MRVITGLSRGSKLITLEGMDTRPTTDRVKESIFNMIQFELEGRKVLDLFAGSGQLGIEALSRGAESAVFIDQNPEAVKVIRQNLLHTKLAEKAKVLASDYASYLSHATTEFDIALMDPPYRQGLATAALPMVAALMSRYGVIVCETAAGEELPEQAGDFELSRRNVYGKASIAVYRFGKARE
ncbi:MAG TPA: 16S rRNA (guanine(966)-N(2))-methyltransferase RsmD [Clostridia bacterium]|nr:16S rRNA (guanine(966)-N(2))-methyltransferase RsmD [Clostridia bacterium]